MTPQFTPAPNGILSVGETSDLHKTLKELNVDESDGDGFTSIDMRTRLTSSQIPSLVGLDVLCLNGVYPKSLMRIGQSVKRLAISIQGKGRKEFVEVSKGMRNDGVTETVSAGKSLIERGQQ